MKTKSDFYRKSFCQVKLDKSKVNVGNVRTWKSIAENGGE